MDWFPLWNSLRIAAIICIVVFFTGILAAYYLAKAPRLVKGFLDVLLTLPLVLPPTVVGYFLILLLGVRRPLGSFLLEFASHRGYQLYCGVLHRHICRLLSCKDAQAGQGFS